MAQRISRLSIDSALDVEPLDEVIVLLGEAGVYVTGVQMTYGVDECPSVTIEGAITNAPIFYDRKPVGDWYQCDFCRTVSYRLSDNVRACAKCGAALSPKNVIDDEGER